MEGWFDTPSKRFAWAGVLIVSIVLLNEQLKLPLPEPGEKSTVPPPPPPPKPPVEDHPWPPGTRWDIEKYG
jgi:hypothetical protein